MQHVAHPVPATWRGGTLPEIAARIQLRGRVVRLYRRITAGAVLIGVRQKLGARWVGIVQKARSETQTPSTLERMGEQLIAFFLAGAKPQDLRQVSVALDGIVDDLLDAGPVHDRDVLQSVRAAMRAEAQEDEAEAALLCRGDRELTPADLARLIDTKETEIAADRDAIVKARRLLAQKDATRLGLTVIRGGRC